jgi:hypothetical protein
MVLIYGEARGHSELVLQIYGERFSQRILLNARIFVNVVQHLRDFGRFEINKRDLDRQGEDRILVAEGEILLVKTGILNRVRVSYGEACIVNDGKHFELIFSRLDSQF